VQSLAARLGLPLEQIVKLDANENAYGPCPAARRALAELTPQQYPDAGQRCLRQALAGFTGAPFDSLLAGCGSDELLSLLAHVLLEPGDRVLTCPPTFPMYAFYAQFNAAEVVNVPRRADMALDLDGILAAVEQDVPKIIYLDSPGNPGGRLAPEEVVDRLLDLPVLVVLDEAYIEFADPDGLGRNLSRIAEVPERENLVVLRTFSKWAGLAGLRVGFGAFPGWLAPALWKAKSPYNLTAPAAEAAIASVGDLPAFKDAVQRIIADRERLAGELACIPGLLVYPSDANFLLVRVGPQFGLSVVETCEVLKKRGVLVRLFAELDCLRISVGTTEQNEALLCAIRELVIE
jgi:histidinol-phosphate aminotransferase